jgi:hypothetical protein
MSALAVEHTNRRSRQDLLETLLRELDDRRRELYRLKAGGAQRAGVRDQKQEFVQVHRHLYEVAALNPSESHSPPKIAATAPVRV